MKLTIFTPTYNRGEKLITINNSIQSAISKIEPCDSVEWLIVDDGSKKPVKDIVDKFVGRENLNIVYFFKENGGKHTAYNYAIEKASGDLFVCVDDDDPITENALSDIFMLGKKYSNANVSGFVGRVISKDGKPLGRTIFDDYIKSNTIEIRDKYKFWGEPEIYYTKILKNYRFPIFEGENFLTEAYVFDQITIKHPLIYTNIPMQIKEFLPGGLTDNTLKIRSRNPRGTEAYYYQRENLSTQLKYKIKAAINRNRFAKWIKTDKPKRKLNFYELIAKPIAFLMFIKDKSSYNR